MYSNKEPASNDHHSWHRSCHTGGLCAALLLSSSATYGFAPIAPASRRSTLVLRSAVIQRYRMDDPHQRSSDVYTFLPSRLTTIQLVDTRSQFRAQVIEETNSLVIVRFYAEICPSCRATGNLFRKWSRDISASDTHSNLDCSAWGAQEGPLPIKFLEMPFNKNTASFLKDELNVSKLPYCHVYHPKFGLVEERLVMNKDEFEDFVYSVHCWSNGGCKVDLGEVDPSSHGNKEYEIEFESQDGEKCVDFC